MKGVSTGKADDVVGALGIDGISRSEVSRICRVLDEGVKTFLARPIEGEHPYVWLDATFHKIREGGRVIQVASVAALASRASLGKQYSTTSGAVAARARTRMLPGTGSPMAGRRRPQASADPQHPFGPQVHGETNRRMVWRMV